MGTSIKLRSITKRWVISIMMLDIIVILLCEVILGMFMFSYYRNAVIDAASDYVRDINMLSITDEVGFPKAARRYAQTFQYRDKIEVQIFDNNGNMLVTTNGFASLGVSEVSTDYTEATQTKSEAWWYGENDNGEKVLAVTNILPDLGYGSNGAYRVLVSMEEVIKSYLWFLVLVVLVGLVALAFSMISGRIFSIYSLSITPPVGLFGYGNTNALVFFVITLSSASFVSLNPLLPSHGTETAFPPKSSTQGL